MKNVLEDRAVLLGEYIIKNPAGWRGFWRVKIFDDILSIALK